MYRQKELMECFTQWEKHLKEQKIPTWDELPSLDLYMDQVLVLLNKYADIMRLTNSENVITAPMINNYVKLKIMPAPIKKKYNKVHLAYLIVICSLKQTLSMSTIQKIIPLNLSEDEVRGIYETFATNHKKVLKTTYEKVKDVSQYISDPEKQNSQGIYNLVIQNAIYSNLAKLLTEKLSDMQENND